MITQHDLSAASLRRLIATPTEDVMSFTQEQRATLASQFRAVPATQQRRVDAWSVERSGARHHDFMWSPATARRTIARQALTRFHEHAFASITLCVHDVLDELLDRAARGRSRGGSLAAWLANLAHPIQGIVAAEAVAWATEALELYERFDAPYAISRTDAYYDVAGARTSLRGARDAVVTVGEERVLLRLRSGLPGRTAGAGLRADLVIDALADVDGRAAARAIGIWPQAGLALAVSGNDESVRAGARDLVRSAMASYRQNVVRAA